MPGLSAMIQAGVPDRQVSNRLVFRNNPNSSGLAGMAKHLGKLMPIPREEQSGLTEPQTAIILQALAKDILDRNFDVLVKLEPDIQALQEDWLIIKKCIRKVDEFPPGHVRTTLSCSFKKKKEKETPEAQLEDGTDRHPGGGQDNTPDKTPDETPGRNLDENEPVQDLILKASFRALERANKIQRVLYLEKTFLPAQARLMDKVKEFVERRMKKIRRSLEKIVVTLNARLPPGADFGLKPHKDIKLYEGSPILYYEDIHGGGEWYVATYDHPVVIAPGTPWNKWFRNCADPGQGLVGIKMPPVGQALVDHIQLKYRNAGIRFLGSAAVVRGEVEIKSAMLKRIHKARLLKTFLSFRGDVTAELTVEDVDTYGDKRFKALPTYNSRHEVNPEALGYALTKYLRGAWTTPGMGGPTMATKVFEFMAGPI